MHKSPWWQGQPRTEQSDSGSDRGRITDPAPGARSNPAIFALKPATSGVFITLAPRQVNHMGERVKGANEESDR
jgi:hypothetical protein